MKKIMMALMTLLLMASFLPAGHAADPSIAGVWSVPILKGKDKGKERSQVEIFEKDGVYYGKIVKLTSVPENALCTKCKKERKDKPLMGMLILWNLKKEAGRYVEGKIYDVEAGKEYKCSIAQITPDRLKITASLLFLSESHYWTRVK
ncbi:MAG: DUF2147 domain-containing protein [Smithellaceae bacterium]|jgi:uncharacterized protein (DUF2147 family)|nr:DUF2147 domain-containing protein [Smithellaceae bacterium]MDD3259107.1 DUF2147 domain-containing protein [Smithellaceae bacterium]MDD3849930.1 DUF2147 domain-containing protein [Smithellaceae bacterium]